MRGPMNVSAMLNEAGDKVHVTAGPRNKPLAVTVDLDMDQAKLLYDLLGVALSSERSEQEYQDWLARQAFPQVDQGGEVIPMHTMEDDLA